MKRELIMAAIAALGLAACRPELTESQPPSNAGAAPAQPAEAGKPGGSDPAVAQAAAPAGTPAQAAASEKQDGARPAAGDGKEDDKKEDGEKKPQ